MSIKIEDKGIVSFLAACVDCDWQARKSIVNDTPSTQSIRNATLRHVKDTGHIVAINEESRTVYKPE